MIGMVVLCLVAAMFMPPKIMASNEVNADMNASAKAGSSEMEPFSMSMGAQQRLYYVHRPKGYDAKKQYPLVLAFHGGGGKTKMMDRLTGLNSAADEHAFIVVYPEGIDKHWNDGRAANHPKDEHDDVAFINALIDKLKTQYAIDSSRIYATGISNGGFFSQYLAAHLPGKFAAIASVAATVSVEMSSNPTPPHPVPIMFILGEADPLVRYTGGDIKIGWLNRGKSISAEESVKFWVKANHCNGESVSQTYSEPSPSDGTHASSISYSGGTNGSEVILVSIANGGHTWPSGWQYLPERMVGKVSYAISANDVIWNFFLRHQLKANS